MDKSFDHITLCEVLGGLHTSTHFLVTKTWSRIQVGPDPNCIHSNQVLLYCCRSWVCVSICHESDFFSSDYAPVLVFFLWGVFWSTNFWSNNHGFDLTNYLFLPFRLSFKKNKINYAHHIQERFPSCLDLQNTGSRPL